MDIILFDKIMNTGDFIFNTYISKPNFKEKDFIDFDEETYEMTLKPIIQNITKFPTSTIVDETSKTKTEEKTKTEDRKIKLFEDSLDNINDNQIFNSKLNEFTNKALELNNKLYTSSNSPINYVSDVIYFLNTYNLLNNIWDTSFNNKVFCLGTGDFYKQAFPNFVINKIKSGHKFEIILFDDCEDTYGCPDSFNEWLEFLTMEPVLLTKQNLANLKITIIKQKISIYGLIYSLIDKITSISKCFIIDTIATGHLLTSSVDKINKINTFLKEHHKIFYDEYILKNKLIYYFSTGKKIILFNKDKQEFEGYPLEYELFKTNCKRKEDNRYCELDFFDDDDIYNNNYQKIIKKLSTGDSKQKYLKYKSKYLMLKKLLNPYN